MDDPGVNGAAGVRAGPTTKASASDRPAYTPGGQSSGSRLGLSWSRSRPAAGPSSRLIEDRFSTTRRGVRPGGLASRDPEQEQQLPARRVDPALQLDYEAEGLPDRRLDAPDGGAPLGIAGPPVAEGEGRRAA